MNRSISPGVPWPVPVAPKHVLALVVVGMGILFMPAEMYSGDPMTMREETRAILLRGELAVSESVAREYATKAEPGQYVVDNPSTGRAYSKYGSMAAILYALPLGLELLFEGHLPPFVSERRLVYLNVFNIALSVLAALSLQRSALRLGASPWLGAAYVAACFYTSFVWNYLRVQNSEIMQLLLFSWAFSAFLDIVDDRENNRHSAAVFRLWAACAALLLTKVAYLPLGPLFALGLLVDRRVRDRVSWPIAAWREASCHALLATVCLGTWAIVNHIKFGAPWLTGYHAWRPGSHGFTGSLEDSLPQLLFGVQWGLPFNFPLLLLAVPFVGHWLHRQPIRYGTVALIAAAYVSLIGLLPSWRGEMCYGPRYWLFVLPLAALPAVDALAACGRPRLGSIAWTLVVVGTLGYSASLQWHVNRKPFFAFYDLRAPLEQAAEIQASAFFVLNAYGKVIADMDRAQENLVDLEWWRDMKPRIDPAFAEQYEQHVRHVCRQSNLYWWPRGG